MTIVERLHSSSDLGPEHAAFTPDTITLTWAERRQGHGKRRSDGGLEFAVSLPGGAILKQDDCFVLEPERTIVAVREALEPVYTIRPATSYEWAFYAYHVGNRHQEVMIGQTELILLQSPAVRSLLDQLHVPFDSDTRPFTAAPARAGHSH